MRSLPSNQALIGDLQARLEGAADESTRSWWEGYLRGAASFRGVSMPDTRRMLHDWYEAHDLEERPPSDQLGLAFDLIRQSHTEDKLAGILIIREVLLPSGSLDWAEAVPRWARLFDEGYLADWNSVDWFCVKVLGPSADRFGEDCARAIASWRDAENLWRRRASGVAFVNLAKRGEENFPGFSDMLLDVSACTVRSPERFVQTGTGWVLRELSVAEPDRVRTFIEEHLGHFTREGLRYAVKKLPEADGEALLEAHRRL